MATILKIGTQAQYDASGLYDLISSADDNIYTLLDGVLPETPGEIPGTWEVKLRCYCTGTSKANLIAEEKTVRDHIIAGRRYARDKHRNAPVYVWYSADGETAKRAVLVGGSLLQAPKYGSSPLLSTRAIAFYDLTLVRRQFEGISATTAINAQEMDGVNNKQLITSVKGDEFNRISLLRVQATADNDEDTPLTEGWIGIRPEYGGDDNFNPVWEWEKAQSANLVNETALASVADSNTYPSGSSSNNAIEVDFADSVMEKRATLSLRDAIEEISANMMTNGGAEDGDTSGWDDDTGVTASSNATYRRSGSYGFRGQIQAAPNNTITFYQDVTVSAGEAYYAIMWHKVVSAAASPSVRGTAYFVDAGGSRTGAYVIWYNVAVTDTSWTRLVGIGVAPSDAVSLRMAYTSITTDASDFAFDTIAVHNFIHDHWRGDYTVLMRAKLDTASKSVDAYLTFGYAGSDTRKRIGDNVKVEATDWTFYNMGTASFPPGRQLTDEDAIWRLANLGFDLYAQMVTGNCDMFVDCLFLVPALHAAYFSGVSIAQSSNYASDEREAKLEVYTSENLEIEVFAYDETFTGIDNSIRRGFTDWRLPAENCMLVAVFQRDASHEIADDFTLTLAYVPVYEWRNTD